MTDVSAEKPLHARDQIGLERFYHQVQMIQHQPIRMGLPIGFDTGLSQSHKETIPVRVGFEDGVATILTIQDVVNGAWMMNCGACRWMTQAGKRCQQPILQ